MSNSINDIILEEIRELGDVVQFHRDHWTGTLWDYTLEEAYLEAIKTLDPTRINKLLKNSSIAMFEAEYQPEFTEYREQHPKSTGFNLEGMIF